MLRRRLIGWLSKTWSANAPLNGPHTAGGRDIVDFRIERSYVEICRSCFLHFARKRSSVEICRSCFLHCLVNFRIERPYVEICPSCFLHSARMIWGKKILGSGGRRWWGCTATQQIAGKDSSLHFIIIEYNSQSRAGTKPPLQVKCLRRFTIWRGCFYRRAPRVKIFLRASRASRALQFYIVSFSFSTTLYLRQCPLGSTLPPYFFLL